MVEGSILDGAILFWNVNEYQIVVPVDRVLI